MIYNNNVIEFLENNYKQSHEIDEAAYEDADGNKEWWLNGEKHKMNGSTTEGAHGYSTTEGAHGYKSWYLNGQRHRIDGPAIKWADGHRQWWVNGKRHRLDGPAIRNNKEYKEWYIDGELVTRITDFMEILS